MSLTLEQRHERTWFAAQVAATGQHYRVTVDAEGWPVITGRFGRVEWAGERGRIYVFTTSTRMVPKLLAVPGVRRWQMGDAEVRLWFPVDTPATLAAVCGLIRARVRRVLSEAQRERFAAVRSPGFARRPLPESIETAPESTMTPVPGSVDPPEAFGGLKPPFC